MRISLFRISSLFLLLSLFVWVGGVILAQQTQDDRAFQYARQLYEDGLYDVAAEQFQRYLNEYPRGAHRPESALQLGKAYRAMGEYDQARKQLLQVDLDYPGTPEAREALYEAAAVYEESGEPERAAKAFQRLHLYYPEGDRTAAGLLRGADDAVKADNLQLAESLLNAVVDDFYDTSYAIDARLKLAEIYHAQNEHQLAWNQLDKALQGSPSRVQKARLQLLQAEVARDLWGGDRADEIYSEVIDANRDSLRAVAILRRGELATNRGDLELAERMFMRAADADYPSIRQDALENQGDLYRDEGNHSEARYKYAQALEAGEPPGRLRLKYGYSLEHIGEFEDAFQQYQQANRDLDSTEEALHRSGLRRLATAATRTGRYRQAITAYQELLRQSDTRVRPEIYLALGEMYHQYVNGYPEAIRYYTLVIDSFPRYPEVDKVVYRLGRAQMDAGELDMAKQTFLRMQNSYAYSGFYPDASQHLWYIRNFHSGSQQTSFNQLSSLFGQMLLGEESPELRYRLGKIQFQHQQNYEHAAAQLRELLSGEGIAQSIRDSAMYYLAESNRLIAAKAGYDGDSSRLAMYRQRAVDGYQELLAAVPGGSGLQEQALLHLGTLYRETNPDKAVDYLEQLRRQRPREVRFGLALAGVVIATGDTTRALSVLQEVLEDNANDPHYPEALAQAADLARESGQRSLAEQYYREYVETTPEGPAGAEARWALLQSARSAGRYQEARQLAEELRETAFYTRFREMAGREIGHLYLDQDEPREAADWFSDLLEMANKPSDFLTDTANGSGTALHYWAGIAYYRSGKTETGIQHLRKYVQRGRDPALMGEALKMLGDHSERQSEFREARGYYQQAANYYERSADSRASLMAARAGEMLFHLGDYQAAADELIPRAKEIYTDSAKVALWEKGIIALIRSGEVGESRREEEKYADVMGLGRNAPSRMRFDLEEARWLAGQKNFQRSVDILERLQRRDLPSPLAEEVQYEIGRQYVLTNEYEKAVDLLTDLTTREGAPAGPVSHAYITLGTVYYEQEQPDNAVAAFRNALQAGAEGEYRRVALRNLIKLYEENGLWDAAIAAARNYITEFPRAQDRFSTRIQIGNYLMNMGEFERARDHLRTLLREADSEDSAEIQFWLGKAYQNQHRYREAVLEFLKIPYLLPPTKLDWSASALWEAGNSYEKLDQNENAVALYERIIREQGASSNYGRYARRRINQIQDR